MIIDDHHYDFIIIGSGAGGATLAHQLSKEGKWVLLLESCLLYTSDAADE